MRRVLVGLGILIFILLSLKAWTFIVHNRNDTCNTDTHEPFAVGAITRAADCNCLPGYIPSSSSKTAYGGKIYINVENGGNYYVFNPRGTKELYWIQVSNPCGIPNIQGINLPNVGKYPSIESSKIFGQAAEYTYKGVLPCGLVKKDEGTSSSSPYYFCQSLTDKNKTRSCY